MESPASEVVGVLFELPLAEISDTVGPAAVRSLNEVADDAIDLIAVPGGVAFRHVADERRERVVEVRGALNSTGEPLYFVFGSHSAHPRALTHLGPLVLRWLSHSGLACPENSC